MGLRNATIGYSQCFHYIGLPLLQAVGSLLLAAVQPQSDCYLRPIIRLKTIRTVAMLLCTADLVTN